MWCLDDRGRDSWDWVGPPTWEESIIQLHSVEWKKLLASQNGASPDCIFVVVVCVVVSVCLVVWVRFLLCGCWFQGVSVGACFTVRVLVSRVGPPEIAKKRHQGTQTRNLGWTIAFNRGHNSTRPKREKKKRNMERKWEKQARKFGSPRDRGFFVNASPRDSHC